MWHRETIKGQSFKDVLFGPRDELRMLIGPSIYPCLELFVSLVNTSLFIDEFQIL